MTKMTLAILALIFSQQVLAGDPGYSSKSCTSKSGRTVFTELSDWSTDNGTIYTLIIDGVPAVYKLSDLAVREDGDDGFLSILKNNKTEVEMQYGDDDKSMTITVHKDPRNGTIAENNATVVPFDVALTCKNYYPAP
ncbi:MAG: hypothetical protein KDD33_05090 [Bdellovibrionales bacterium]|nr:hypothetical protein [Bdellovibrionales bacterium]